MHPIEIPLHVRIWTNKIPSTETREVGKIVAELHGKLRRFSLPRAYFIVAKVFFLEGIKAIFTKK